MVASNGLEKGCVYVCVCVYVMYFVGSNEGTGL